jgi:histone acetyltransferase HTATIP/histone acetyltransferase MYST1
LNRRNDQWLPHAYLRPTGEEIPVEEGGKRKGTKEKVHEKYSEHEGMDQQSLQVHLELTKFKTVHSVRIGKHQCDAWYYSSYPPTFHNVDCLYLCEFCLSFYAVRSELLRHADRCPLFHPPGDEIYRDARERIAVFEVDGLKNPVYCENLSFLSKLFLDHKNIEYDTTVFLYYVLCEIVADEYHLAGYFSKVLPAPRSPRTRRSTSPASSSCPTSSARATASS